MLQSAWKGLALRGAYVLSSEQDTGPGRPICGPTMALGIRARHWAGQDGLLGSPFLTCAGA